jgi:hypothetical protein
MVVGPQTRDQWLWAVPCRQTTMDRGGIVYWSKWGAVMKPLLLWLAVPLMLLGASMLIAGIGSTALWIAVVTVGIALVVIGRVKPGAAGRR